MPTLPKLLEMIEQLISIPSISNTQPQFDTSNQPVIDCIANWLNDLGFQIEIVPSSKDKSNLIAWIGEGDEGLVLSGHTDTVNYDRTGWNTDPFKAVLRDDRVFGLGSADMKSFLDNHTTHRLTSFTLKLSLRRHAIFSCSQSIAGEEAEAL